ncbi:hypothetical protein Ddye_023874 [Dipteronia dyeriana]|uniref:Disease resistance N-terminal domain-containing protein n=1 Tax=Dipteronia dyeriana TaxID=168575 RepID=A0AAD9TUD9_9ROSI|nr:hypothetical protein Ddye_023874 [Dipteronia dyeriana]
MALEREGDRRWVWSLSGDCSYGKLMESWRWGFGWLDLDLDSGGALQDWLRKLKDAAYRVDDILDECAKEAAVRFEFNGQNSSLINKVRTSCLTPHNILFRRKIGSRMRDIRERLDDIVDERSKFHLQEGGVDGFLMSVETVKLAPSKAELEV